MTRENSPGVASAGADEKVPIKDLLLSSATLPPAVAHDRIVDLLRGIGKKVRVGSPTMVQCPSHDDREASLAIYRKVGKVKLVCFAGCDEELDILPALGLDWPDKYDEPRGWVNRTGWKPDPAIKARQQARREMTPVQRAVDDLLALPDLGERICLAIARARPELYIAEREGLFDDE